MSIKKLSIRFAFLLLVISPSVFSGDKCSSDLDSVFSKYYLRSLNSDLTERQRNEGLSISSKIARNRGKISDCEIFNSLPSSAKDISIAEANPLDISVGEAINELVRLFPDLSRSTGSEGIVREGKVTSATPNKIVIRRRNWYREQVKYPIQDWIISFDPRDLSKVYFDKGVRALVIETDKPAIEELYWENEDEGGRVTELLDYTILGIYISEENGQKLVDLLSVLTQKSK